MNLKLDENLGERGASLFRSEVSLLTKTSGLAVAC